MNPRLLGRALMIASRVETTFRAGITSGSTSAKKTTFYSKQESFLLEYVMRQLSDLQQTIYFTYLEEKLALSKPSVIWENLKKICKIRID